MPLIEHMAQRRVLKPASIIDGVTKKRVKKKRMGNTR